MEKTVRFWQLPSISTYSQSVKEADVVGKKKMHQTQDVPLHFKKKKKVVSKAMQSPCQCKQSCVHLKGDIWHANTPVAGLSAPPWQYLHGEWHTHPPGQYHRQLWNPWKKKRKRCFTVLYLLIALKAHSKASSTNVKLPKHTCPPIKKTGQSARCDICGMCEVPDLITFHPAISDFIILCLTFG